MITSIEGRVFIVTGGGSGIGRASALKLAAGGGRLVVADLNEKGADETASQIASVGGEAAVIRTDVSNEADAEAMVAFAVERFGRLDGAFNNAGVEMAGKRVHELSERAWRRAIDINLTGVFFCLKHEIAAMLETGGGAIVNMSSGSGAVAIPRASDYVSSKHGVVGLTKAAALDYARDGIRVNALLPGSVMTPMVEDRLLGDTDFASVMETIKANHPIGRLGKPEEIADAVLWLLSDASSFVTGSGIHIDGGYTAG